MKQLGAVSWDRSAAWLPPEQVRVGGLLWVCARGVCDSAFLCKPPGRSQCSPSIWRVLAAVPLAPLILHLLPAAERSTNLL